MSIGLDLGCTEFRSLRYQGEQLLSRSCPAVMLEVADTATHRRLLERDSVPYAISGSTLVLLGHAALEWGALLTKPVRRLLPDGQLPAGDPVARQILSLLIDAVLPISRQRDEFCTLTIPGELLPVDESPERSFFLQMVRQRGYRPQVIGQGHAITFSELNHIGFSGIGVNLGASQSEFSLNRSGRELARCVIPYGLDELCPWEEQASSPTSILPELNDSTLTDFLVELLLEAGARIGQHDGFRVLTQPVPLAVAGGIVARDNFETLFQKAWNRACWPIRMQNLKTCTDGSQTVARGCLIHAIWQSQPVTEDLAIAA
ncbi:hypothetical protein GC163_03080 [bacterium]|nr:hypothetical protein [bacterium]